MCIRWMEDLIIWQTKEKAVERVELGSKIREREGDRLVKHQTIVCIYFSLSLLSKTKLAWQTDPLCSRSSFPYARHRRAAVLFPSTATPFVVRSCRSYGCLIALSFHQGKRKTTCKDEIKNERT